MSKYTKGEWEIETIDTESSNFVIVRKSDPHTSVAATFGGIPEDEEKANARLIAAVPDLLAACEAQHQAIDHLFALLITLNVNFLPSKSGQPWEAIQQGKAAIAKAKKR